MPRSHPLVVGLLVLAPLAGCEKKTADPATTSSTATGARASETTSAARPRAAESHGALVSCRAGMGLCSEWRGLTLEEVTEAKASCNEPGDVFSDEACQATGLLGTCIYPAQKLKMYLAPSPAVRNVADAKEMCADGIFTAAN